MYPNPTTPPRQSPVRETGPTVAAIYVRVSSEKQEDNTSLGTQEAACRAYCVEQGYAVGTIYREVYTGAALWERPHLSTLREQVKHGGVDVVVAYAIDRLSRDQAHIYILLDEWERHGARVEFVTEDFDATPLGKMLLSLKGFAAEVEREKIIERTMRGLQARAEAGKFNSGPRPLYGYRWPVEFLERDGELVPTVIRDRYELDPATSPVVQRIFRWYTEGVPLLAITTRLNTEGVPSPTGTAIWTRAVVHRLLKNPGYKGEAFANRHKTVKVRGKKQTVLRPREEWLRLPDGVIPPLVDEATWTAVQARAQRNAAEASRHNQDPEAFLLRGGYILCGHCGRPAFANTTPGYKGARQRIYRVVSNAEQHAGCRAVRMLADELDRAVETYLKRVVLNQPVLERMIERVRAEDTTAADLAQVDATLTTVRRQQAQTANAVATLDDPDTTAPLLAKLAELGREKRRLDAIRAELLTRREHATAIRSRLAGLHERAAVLAATFHTLPYQAKRDLLAAIALRVYLYPTDAPDRYVIESDVDAILAAIMLPSPTC